MKRTAAFILTVCMMLFCASCTFAEKSVTDESTENRFTIIKIPFPENIEERDSWRTFARFKDSLIPIPLSQAYDGYVYATVATENAQREIEAFVPEKVHFTDIENDSDQFDMEWMAYVGVVRGNDKGEARPEDNITRAQAAAMIMRFIGKESIYDENEKEIFDDVKKDAWYYNAVRTAYECDVIKGDSEKTFSPEREVTREELTTMVIRALEYASLRCPTGGNDNIADRDKISEWAKKAFEKIGVCYVYDYPDDEQTDWETPLGYLNPQKKATRGDAARLLNNVMGVCQVYPSEAAKVYGFDKEMPVIDGSTSTYPFTQSVYEALFSNGRTHKQFPAKHSKSHASYERLINGEVDMLFASVYPASDILALAEKKGVELELIPIAYDAMVFFTNADNTTKGLTQEQISDIYVNDAYDNWAQLGGEEALLYPYCRNNDSGSHAQMEKHFLNGKEIHPHVQEETSYTMSNVLTDVMGAQTDNPKGYALGYSIYYYFQNMDLFYETNTNLKLLEIDGVMPNDETIANGTYPLSNNTYVVLRKDTPKDAPARKMAEFMLAEAGQICVENAGFGKLIK